MTPALKAIIALGSGALLFLSCADFDIWPLTWIAIVPLLWVVLHPSTTRPAWYGFLCGLVANAGGFYWILGFLGRFGHLPMVAALPIFLLLVAYQAVTFTAFAWIVRRAGDRLGIGMTWLAPVAYVALELVVPYVFPWYLAITQAWVRPVIQIADLTGPLGVSFLLVLCNGAIYDLWSARRAGRPIGRASLAAAAAVLVGALGYGQIRIHQIEARRAAAPKVKLGVVQANIGIGQKWRPQLAAQQLALHQRLSAELERRGADLILWPESSYPYLFRRDQRRDWPEGDPRRAQLGFTTPLVFGSLTIGQDSRYPYNSVLLLDRGGEIRGRFDKNILMVFGEYIPYYEHLRFIKRWIPETSNWARGQEVTVFPFALRSGAEAAIGPMICYEDIFPSFGRRLVRRHPNLLVNLTNDAWFGRTSEPHEHLALAVYRSVEMRLDLVRAVNTGVSAFIDATGRVVRKSPSVDPEETPEAPPATLLEEVAIQQPSTIYATLGEWFGGLCLLLLLILGERALARSGRLLRWPSVGIGAAALVAVVVVGIALVRGPAQVPLALGLLAHRAIDPGNDAAAFATGAWLIVAAALGSVVAGWATSRSTGSPAQPARLEAALSVVLVLVVPAVALGSLEGEQAGLVIGALAAIGLALGGARLARRLAGAGPGAISAEKPGAISAKKKDS